MTLRVLLEAELESTAAAVRYETERLGLGAEYLQELDVALSLIEAHPLHHPRYEAVTSTRYYRRVVLKRFPYVVIYEIRPDENLIVAIAHASRQPGYWLNRLPEE